MLLKKNPLGFLFIVIDMNTGRKSITAVFGVDRGGKRIYKPRGKEDEGYQILALPLLTGKIE